MQSTSKAFQNGVLKPLEDTPPFVYFILCTTDPQKLLRTIKNRCTTYEVESLYDRDMIALIEDVAGKEEKPIAEKVVDDIVEVADGCPRQALVILDQVIDMDPRRQSRAVRDYVTNEANHIVAHLNGRIVESLNHRNLTIRRFGIYYRQELPLPDFLLVADPQIVAAENIALVVLSIILAGNWINMTIQSFTIIEPQIICMCDLLKPDFHVAHVVIDGEMFRIEIEGLIGQDVIEPGKRCGPAA